MVPGAGAFVDHCLMARVFGLAHLAYGGVPLRDRATKDDGVNPEPLCNSTGSSREGPAGHHVDARRLAGLSSSSFARPSEMTDGNLTTKSAPCRKRLRRGGQGYRTPAADRRSR